MFVSSILADNPLTYFTNETPDRLLCYILLIYKHNYIKYALVYVTFLSQNCKKKPFFIRITVIQC